jgi:hypothetical protein
MKFRPLLTPGKIIAFIALASLVSCQKDGNSSSTANSDAVKMTDSSTAADNAYYDVLNTAFVGVADNPTVWNTHTMGSGKVVTMGTQVLGTGSLGCAIYTLDDSVPGEYPKTLTLDFGSGCASADGIVRSGKISYYFNNLILIPGATASVTFTNYVTNGYGINGQYTITNISTGAALSFTTEVTNGIVIYPDASNYHYSHNKTYIQTAGMSTPYDISDDVYSLSGTASFSSSAGNSLILAAQASAPLTRAVACRYISQGVLSFVYNNSVSGILDFGDGTCDSTAELTIGNLHETISLR